MFGFPASFQVHIWFNILTLTLTLSLTLTPYWCTCQHTLSISPIKSSNWHPLSPITTPYQHTYQLTQTTPPLSHTLSPLNTIVACGHDIRTTVCLYWKLCQCSCGTGCDEGVIRWRVNQPDDMMKNVINEWTYLFFCNHTEIQRIQPSWQRPDAMMKHGWWVVLVIKKIHYETNDYFKTDVVMVIRRCYMFSFLFWCMFIV